MQAFKITKERSLGKKVIFAIDTPELGINPNDCINRFGFSNNSNVHPCFFERKLYDKRNDSYRKMVNELKHKIPSLMVFDPTDLFCYKEKCYGIKNNTLLYNDDDHLNDIGADILGKGLKNYISSIQDIP